MRIERLRQWRNRCAWGAAVAAILGWAVGSQDVDTAVSADALIGVAALLAVGAVILAALSAR